MTSTRNPGRVARFLYLLLCLSGPIRLITGRISLISKATPFPCCPAFLCNVFAP